MVKLCEIVDTLLAELRDPCKQRKYIEMRMVNVNLALGRLARELDKEKQHEVLRPFANLIGAQALMEHLAQTLRDCFRQSGRFATGCRNLP